MLAFDAASGGNSSPLSHTCDGSGPLLVFVANLDGGGPSTIPVPSYNGVPGTPIGSGVGPYSGFSVNQQGFIWPAPDAGAHDITWSGSTFGVLAASYKDANASQPDSYSETQSTDPAPLTTVADNCWGVVLVGTTASNAGPGAGTTLRQGSSFSFDVFALIDTNGPLSPAGLQSIDFTAGGSMAATAVGIAPPAGGTLFELDLDGTITPSGTARQAASKAGSGTVTSAGGARHAAHKTTTGQTTPSGVLATLRVALRTYTGTMTPSGTVAGQALVKRGGLIAPTGQARQAVAQRLVASLTPTGVVRKLVSASAAGALACSGVASSVLTFSQSLASTLGLSGAVTRSTSKHGSGTVTSSGAVRKDVAHQTAGAVAPSGVLRRTPQRVLSGVLSFVGTLVSGLVATLVPDVIEIPATYEPTIAINATYEPIISIEARL